jgi:hypothetical protein
MPWAAEFERTDSLTLPHSVRFCYAAVQLQSELQQTYDGVIIWVACKALGPNSSQRDEGVPDRQAFCGNEGQADA